jgi:integrase
LSAASFYRKPIGKRSTKKRQTPAPIPPRLLAHLRRWRDRKLIATCFVGFNGKPVASVKKGFKTAVGLARLPGNVTPHTLRHTAATWLMQRGVPIWEAAGFLGMSPEVLQDTYGHHHPRPPARSGSSNRPEGPVRFGGRNGGQLDRGSKRDEKT